MPFDLLPCVVSFNLRLAPVLGWGSPAGYEWVVIGLVGLLIFGRRLPAAARGLGESYREFRRALRGQAAPEIDGGDQAGNTAATAPQFFGSASRPTSRAAPYAGQPVTGE